MKKKILFIMHLPPPVHGLSMVSQQIHNSAKINDFFCCKYVNLSASRKASEITQYSFLSSIRKIGRLTFSFFKTLKHLIFFRPDSCYLTITCHGIPFLKDAPFVLLCKLFHCKIIIHQHNKGMSAYVKKPLYHFLFSIVYKNSTVILLSERLYDDISSIVKKEQIRICPNGI